MTQEPLCSVPAQEPCWVLEVTQGAALSRSHGSVCSRATLLPESPLSRGPCWPLGLGQVGLGSERGAVGPCQDGACTGLVGRQGYHSGRGQMLSVSLCLPSGRRLERCLPLESLGQAGSLARTQLLALGEHGGASSPLSSLGVPIPPLVRAEAGWASTEHTGALPLAQVPARPAGSGCKNTTCQ